MFLIDTCILSELARPAPNVGVATWIAEQDELVVSTMTIQEIAYGVKRRAVPKLDRWFAEIFPVLKEIPVTREISLLAADFQVRSEKQGLPLTDADSVIAATAAITGRILVTRNVKDFAYCSVMLKNPFI